VTVPVPVAVAGTTAVTCVALINDLVVAVTPLIVTASEAEVNPVPVIVTKVPTGPDVGVKLVTNGFELTV
jgi:hypothetical protein